MSVKTRLFWILWVAGMAGILSLLCIDISAVIAAIPLPPGETLPELPPPALLKLVTIIQPTVLMTLAVLAGLWLAGRVGLHSPGAEALANGTPFWAALRPQILPGILTGLAAGAAIVLTWVVAKPFFTAEFVARAEEFNKFIPHAVRFFYGGLTEEVLLRWGVMTVLVWAAWRLLQKGKGRPSGVYVVGAIIASALLFGIGHLPVASMLNGGLTTPLVIYVITGNSIFGVAAGFLYWRRGLEAAMTAHMSAHLVLITAIWLAF